MDSMTDSELIDWLQGHPVTIRDEGRDGFLVNGFSTIGRGPDLRAALHAASESARHRGGIPNVGEGKEMASIGKGKR